MTTQTKVGLQYAPAVYMWIYYGLNNQDQLGCKQHEE